MKLAEWAKEHHVNPTEPNENGAVSVVAYPNFDGHQQLWHLEDYTVSSICGVVVWLVPKKSASNTDNTMETVSTVDAVIPPLNGEETIMPTELRGGVGQTTMPAPTKEELDPQTILNELVYKYGSNFVQWPSYREIVIKAGLEPTKISPNMLAKADQFCRTRYDSLIDWSPLQERNNNRGIYFEWTSRCRRYKVVRQTGRFVAIYYNHEGKDDWVEKSSKKQGNYPKEYSTLEDAFKAVERFHCQQLKCQQVDSNRVSAVKDAEQKGLAGVKVTELAARKPIPTVSIERTGPVSTHANPAAEQDNSATAVADVSESAVATESRTSQGKDQYGCLLGKPPARINAALTTTLQTPESIAAAAGEGITAKRVADHCHYWIKKGKPFREENGMFAKNE